MVGNGIENDKPLIFNCKRGFAITRAMECKLITGPNEFQVNEWEKLQTRYARAY